MAQPEVQPPSWVNLLTLLVHGPTVPVRGLLRTIEGEDETLGWFAWSGEEPPIVAGMRGAADPESTDWETPTRVWWDGVRLRVEEPDGSVNVIADAHTCWQWEQGSDVPIKGSRNELRLGVGGIELLERWTPEHFLGDDFTRPTGPVGATTYLGRLAWTVELAPPEHKPHPMQLVIDAATGMILQKRNDGFGFREEWLEFEVVERHDDALFRWDGPVRQRSPRPDDGRAEHEREMAMRRDWFRTNVAPAPIAIEFEADVLVHGWEDDGSFEASLDRVGGLARRPRSEDVWELHWVEINYRWTTERWDWALQCYDGQLTERGLAKLKAHLRDLP